MNLRFLVIALFVLLFSGCGGGGGGSDSGGAGLNGAITVTATTTGAVVNANATYTNPQTTNLIGVPITFSAQIGNQTISLGKYNTNNSGSVGVSFTPPPFNGTQTVTVIASSDNLRNFASVNLAGRELSVTAPPTLALTTTDAGGTILPFTIPPAAGFVAITDPFFNDVAGHTITISTARVSTNPSDTLIPPASTTTNSGGTADFPGATGTLVVPATVGGVETMTITWTVTDTETGQIGTGITTITLTKTS